MASEIQSCNIGLSLEISQKSEVRRCFYTRVPPIYEKFSDQVPNWAKVVPWQMGQNEPLINQLSLKLKRRQAAQFYEAIFA